MRSKQSYLILIFLITAAFVIISGPPLHAQGFVSNCQHVLINYGASDQTTLDQNQDNKINLLDCLSPAPTATPTPNVGAAGSAFLIAYTDGDGQGIRTIDSDGNNPSQILAPQTAHDVTFLRPEFAGEPTSFVFTMATNCNGSQTSQIHRIQADGQNLQLLTGSVDPFHCNYNNSQPNSGYFTGGSYIMYVANQLGLFPPVIAIIDKVGNFHGYVKSFTSTNGYPRPRPRQSPVQAGFQPKALVYVIKTGTTSDLYTMDSDGTNETVLTPNTLTIEQSEPVFTPDKNYVIYQSKSSNKTDIMKISVNGGTAVKLVDGGTYGAYYPAVSADGSTLVYKGELSGKHGLIKANLDGTNKILILENDAVASLAVDPIAAPPQPTPTPTLNPTNNLYLPLILRNN